MRIDDGRPVWPAGAVVAWAVVSVLALTGCQRGVGEARPAGSAAVAAPAVGSTTHSLTLGGLTRTYRVYRPAGLAGTGVALVVVLHGALGDGRQAEGSYGWDAEADRGRFVVAYPDGYKRTWDASAGCCGPAASQHTDDVGFITRLVATLSAQLPIDRNRVYAAGISNGGLMVYRLACDTNLFAAIGPDLATMINSCPRPAPISVIHIHGTADQTIPYGGGPGKRDNNGTGRIPVKIDGPPVPALIGTWRTIDHCGQPVVTTEAPVTRSLATCPGGRAVELVTIEGAGHQWPGQPGPAAAAARLLKLDPPSTALDATGVMWQFFAAHPRTGGS